MLSLEFQSGKNRKIQPYLTKVDKEHLKEFSCKNPHHDKDDHIVSIPMHLFIAEKGSQNFVFNITLDLR